MRKYLFVIDYQKDFVDGALGFPKAIDLDERIVAKIREYGKGHVYFTRDTHHNDYLNTREGKRLPVVHCIKDSEGWQIYGQTAEVLNEVNAIAIDKSLFGMDISDPNIASLLPEDADVIELVGLVSNICVVSNAIVLQIKYPQAHIIVDASCTDSFDRKLHQEVLDVLQGLQITVNNRSIE